MKALKEIQKCNQKKFKKYSTLITLSKSDRNIKNFMNITKTAERKNLRPCIILPTLKLSHYYTQIMETFSVYIKITLDNYLGGCIISLNHESMKLIRLLCPTMIILITLQNF